MRTLLLRLVYTPLLAASILFLGVGSIRESLLTTMVLFTVAAFVESLLHVFDLVPVLLMAGLAATALASNLLFPADAFLAVFRGVCLLAALTVFLWSRGYL